MDWQDHLFHDDLTIWGLENNEGGIGVMEALTSVASPNPLPGFLPSEDLVKLRAKSEAVPQPDPTNWNQACTARTPSPPSLGFTTASQPLLTSTKRGLDDMPHDLRGVPPVDARDMKRPKLDGRTASAEPVTAKRFCIEELRKSCNSYERPLLRGIVEPS
jgi:hypothetical protein